MEYILTSTWKAQMSYSRLFRSLPGKICCRKFETKYLNSSTLSSVLQDYLQANMLATTVRYNCYSLLKACVKSLRQLHVTVVSKRCTV
jgi:hypothetical protein